MTDFDWLGLAQAITYAHCEAQGLKVSASTLPASGARPNTLADEGEVHASVASPSFQGLTIENMIGAVIRAEERSK